MGEPETANEHSTERIFVAEYLCGGGMFDTPADSIESSLLCEGQAMWRAMIEDFSKWTEVRTPVDPRLGLDIPAHRRIESVSMQPCAAPWAQWIEAARDCDACLVIIPESDGLLAKGVAMLRAAGIEVLAPTGAAIRVTSDKWATAKWLHQAAIGHPPTWTLQPRQRGRGQRAYVCSRPSAAGPANPEFTGFTERGYLVKPRDGSGAMNLYRYDELEPALASMRPHEITQPWLSGRAVSVMVIHNHRTGREVVLPAVWQSIEELPGSHTGSRRDEGTSASDLVYRGGCGPVPREMQGRAYSLVERVLQEMPGRLGGFLGLDLILGEDANHDVVIEVNPRLTVSYIGVRQMTDENLTQRLLEPQSHLPEIQAPTESIAWNV